MSTTTTTPRATSSSRIAAIACVTALAAAAVAGGVAFVAGRDSAPASSASSHSKPAGGGSHTVEPDNAIKAVQQELAELNFYQGPINGYDTAATISAVQDLQREAGLPQTGHMNDQTRQALLRYLAQGDNVMNG
jgi:peptidoglycan hydrolase-like protein with peptidoglycan-binding domain